MTGLLRTYHSLFLQGNALTPDFKYLVQFGFGALDFESGNPSPILDAFVEYVRFRDANIRVGQFFVPFDRARTIRESSLQFILSSVLFTAALPQPSAPTLYLKPGSTDKCRGTYSGKITQVRAATGEEPQPSD